MTSQKNNDERSNNLYYLDCLNKNIVKVSDAEMTFRRGWGKFRSYFSRCFDEKKNHHVWLSIHSPELLASRVPFSAKESKLSLGEVLLRAASFQGLFPKTFFLNQDDRENGKAIIHLIPSPISDLITAVSPVKLYYLDLSLRSFSEYLGHGVFNPTNHSVQAAINDLVGDDKKPYQDICINLAHSLKCRIIRKYNEPADDSLTAILDAIAIDVHATWYWRGENRIDFISRGCHEYVG